MAKILPLRNVPVSTLERRKAKLLDELRVPDDAIRASYIRQFVTCGKRNCRCQRGHKHGPFRYLVQCLGTGKVRKFLLKTPQMRQQAGSAIAGYAEFQRRVEELSQINTELLARGVSLSASAR